MTAPASPAHLLEGGCLVRHQGRLWLKAQRPAKDYINHYLVPSRAEPGMALLYIDPETELEPVAAKPSFSGLSPRPQGEETQFGDLVDTASGRFIKALDIKKDGQRHSAYVDILTGEVRPRQERNVTAIYADWILEI
ncbi:MAG: hypothetical protein EPN26_09805 [Rhodospirillales bacterium]|nr:MAG: hypothetical protein EPN26_09805 [Rhodospirillales bacterium]